MSTDASEFSLEKITEIVKPHLGILPFRKLSDYFSGGVKDRIGEITYHLRLYPKTTNSNMMITHQDFVYLLPLEYTRNFKSGLLYSRVESIWRAWLMLRRTDIGGTFGHWFLLRGMFYPVMSTSEVFDCKDAEIIEATDELLNNELRMTSRTYRSFWEGMLGWLALSIDSRKKALESLCALSKTCEENLNLLP